jgi:glycosyltransferase involved in cell wall biosynthesis
MKILHISTYDASGGAARSAYRVHQGLCRLGFDSYMLVLHKSTQDDRVWQYEPSRNLIARLYRRLRREIYARQYKPYAGSRRDDFQPFSDDRTDCAVNVQAFVFRPDVVNLYWIAGFPDYRYFFQHIPLNIPIVWRLSDMNPFTGGCHYAWDCDKWTGMCGACPELGSEREQDLSRSIWKRKRQAYDGRRIYIVSPSHWLAREVKRSTLLKNQPVTVIPNGLDASVFAPQDQVTARAFFGLPQNRPIILAGANYLQDERKGFRYLAGALQQLPDNKSAMLIMLGEGTSAILDKLPVASKCMGYHQDDQVLARAYAAADFCVIPSVYENLPSMAVEAMACGIPVIGFQIGGLPEVVHHRETGLLARWKDTSDLAIQIQWLLVHPAERQRMGIAARSRVEREHTLEVQARRFAELYQVATETAKKARPVL